MACYVGKLLFPAEGISLKATVENLRGRVEKLSPKESAEGADTVLRGSVRAPKGFSEGKPEAAKPKGRGAEWAMIPKLKIFGQKRHQKGKKPTFLAHKRSLGLADGV